MKELRFYGSSDDLFECDGDIRDEICDCNDVMAYLVESPSEECGLVVIGHYAPSCVPDGTWIVGVTLREEDDPLPDWDMKFADGESSGVPPSFYTPQLVIKAPDDVTVTPLGSDEE